MAIGSFTARRGAFHGDIPELTPVDRHPRIVIRVEFLRRGRADCNQNRIPASDAGDQ
jgi:hypothetical protein